MSNNALRLIFRIPCHSQTGPDTWQDTTYCRVFDVPMPDALAQILRQGGKPERYAALVGCEFVLAEPPA